MKKGTKKRRIAWISAALVAAILIGVIIALILPTKSERFFEGEAEAYYRALIQKGFPEDYAAELTELHLLHPTWEFEPLLITRQNPTYTWDYIIEKETEEGDRNVVYSDSSYLAYQHPFNKELYDSGYYQASTAAVKYFMDPRNFLNETDIFQFYSLSGAEISLDAVKAVLAGTFMENAVLENGRTYAEYFLEIGNELDINPLFLAAKVRNEQGVDGASPIVSGACGDRLWYYYDNNVQQNEAGDNVLTPTDVRYTESELTAYNGLYNFFNVGATGKGLFSIYLGAMQRAAKGTAEMANEWGNGGAWNTKWKALYGGAYFLKTKYIDAYQPTVYLQKFNVDSRASNNFWGQYMTSVFGAMSEGRALCQSFTTLDALDMPATFLIPVYGGMPDKNCADPANGKVQGFASAPSRYTYDVNLFEPKRYRASDAAIYLSTEVYPSHTLTLEGSLEHSWGVDSLEYAWDGGEWHAFSGGESWKLSLSADFPVNTSHILVVRAKVSYESSGRTIHNYCLLSVTYVNVVPIPTAKLSIDVGGRKTELIYNVGSSVVLPTCEDMGFAGWYGSNGAFLPSGARFTIENDVTFSALFLDFKPLSGASLKTDGDAPKLCFSAVIDTPSYQKLNEGNAQYLTLSAILTVGDTMRATAVEIGQIANCESGEWILLDAVTPTLSGDDLGRVCTAQFAANLHYSDGSSRALSPVGQSAQRSAKDVASAALADRGVSYSDATVSVLRSILQST